MRAFYTLGLILIISLSLSSCRKDEIYNTDNYITELSLIIGNDEFNGEIKGNDIYFNIPENTNLKRVNAKYNISEGACIYPQPNQITDWEAIHQLVVTSQDSQERIYQIHFNKTLQTLKGDVVLKNDKDVDAFANKHINIIDGNLIIGDPLGKEEVTSLDKLSHLKEITYDLIINSAYIGKSLDGLNNLQTIGNLVLNKESKESQPLNVNLPNLRKCYQDIVINRGSIEAVQLPKLEEVKKLTINSSIKNSTSFDALKSVYSITISNTNENTNQEGNGTILDFPKLERCDTSIEFTNMDNISDINLPVLTTATEIKVNNLPKIERLQAPLIKSINKITCEDVQQLKTINFFALSKVNTIEIKGTRALENLGEFLGHLQSLKTFDSYNLIVSTPQKIDLSKCNDIEKLEFYDIDLSEVIVPDNENLELTIYAPTKYTTFPNIHAKVLKSLSIENFSNTDNLIISGVEEIKNTLRISETSATNIELKNLKKANKISIGSSDNMVTFKANELINATSFIIYGNNLKVCEFQHLASIDDFTIKASKKLTDIKCPALTTVKTELFIGGDWNDNGLDAISNLDGFSALTKAAKITVKYCKNLSDFKGFKKLFDANGIDKANWEVSNNKYNPTFEDMKAGLFSRK